MCTGQSERHQKEKKDIKIRRIRRSFWFLFFCSDRSETRQDEEADGKAGRYQFDYIGLGAGWKLEAFAAGCHNLPTSSSNKQQQQQPLRWQHHSLYYDGARPRRWASGRCFGLRVLAEVQVGYRVCSAGGLSFDKLTRRPRTPIGHRSWTTLQSWFGQEGSMATG